MKTQWILLLVMLALTMAGCSANQTGGQNDDPLSLAEPHIPPSVEPRQSPTEHPLPEPTSQNYPAISSVATEKFIDLAKQDLAKLLNVETDQIELVSTLEVAWPDSIFGVPKPRKSIYAWENSRLPYLVKCCRN